MSDYLNQSNEGSSWFRDNVSGSDIAAVIGTLGSTASNIWGQQPNTNSAYLPGYNVNVPAGAPQQSGFFMMPKEDRIMGLSPMAFWALLLLILAGGIAFAYSKK